MKMEILCLSFCVLIVNIRGDTWDTYLDENFFQRNKGIFKDLSKFPGRSKEGSFTISNLNNFVDKFFSNWDSLLKKLKLDPLSMNDVTQGYWWGNIMLRNINFHGMSTFRRSGDAIIKYNKDDRQLRIDIPIGIGNIKLECTFKASLIGIGPSGTVTGGVDEINLILTLVIDLNVYQAMLDEYNITKSGHVSIELHGNLLTGWILNLLLDTTTYLFRGIAAGAVDIVAGGAMRNAVNVANSILDVLSLF